MAVTTPLRPAGTAPHVNGAAQLNFDIPDALLTEVDFKWLMAGHGWHVDVARLHTDPAYAAQILGKAMASEFQALRECAVALSGLLNHPDP